VGPEVFALIVLGLGVKVMLVIAIGGLAEDLYAWWQRRTP
jgi:hypothetical protein